MRFCRLLVALLAGGTLATACADISQVPPTPGPRAIFDTTTPILPLPNDVLRGADGFLTLPLSDCSKVPAPYKTQCELTNEIEKSLNTLDGWLTGQTLEIPVDSPLDVSTLPGNVILWDITNPAIPVVVDPSTYFLFFNKGITPATKSPYMITLKNKSPGAMQMPADFPQGHKYFAYVRNTPAPGSPVKDKSGNALIEAPVNFFFKAKSALYENGHSTVSVLDDADAKKLEAGRLLFAPLFAAFEAKGAFKREEIAAFSVFTIQSGPRALYNPTSVNKNLPTPCDEPGKPANASLTSTPTVLFDMALDKTTVSATNFMLFKMNAGVATPVPINAVYTPNPVPGKPYVALTAVPTVLPLQKGTTYMVVTTNGIKSEKGTVTASLTTFSTTRYTYPLLNETTTPVSLNSPFLDNTLDVLILLGGDPATAKQSEWDFAYGMLIQNLQGLEVLRQYYAPFYSAAIAQGVDRYAITALWTFTTTN